MRQAARSKTATCLFRDSDYYRKADFCNGLRRHGYSISDKRPTHPEPGDVLLLWNRTRNFEPVAAQFEAVGGTVIIAENGYIDRSDDRSLKYYALALDRHNGAGRWFVGDRPRFEISEEPWRKRGSHILVLPQRGIGSPGVRMPRSWTQEVVKRLKRITDREIRIRLHPGHKKLDPLADLKGCHAAVTWGSGAGIKALRHGFPVFHELGKWIGHCAASRLAGNIEACNMPDRSELWNRISWAQWQLDEIRSGEAFDGLLNAENRLLLCQS